MGVKRKRIDKRVFSKVETDLVVKFIDNSSVRKRTESSCVVLVEDTKTVNMKIVAPQQQCCLKPLHHLAHPLFQILHQHNSSSLLSSDKLIRNKFEEKIKKMRRRTGEEEKCLLLQKNIYFFKVYCYNYTFFDL